MSIRCVQQSICRRYDTRWQQGFVSVVALVLLMITVLMGRGLVYFLLHGVENSHSFRQEMQLRLAAESMAEKQWLFLKNDDSKLQKIKPGTMVLLDKGNYDDLDYTVYARSKSSKIYIIATAFRRETVRDKITEPHVMVIGVLDKEEDHYVWRGWTH